MSLLSSSTSNSSNPSVRRVGAALQVPLWVCISLVVIDVLINIVFAYPSDPKVTNPSRLAIVF